MVKKVRVRFAPSPTGFLHIGGARTALFNWLFAKHFGGSFILRIEDTDLERVTEGSEETILQSLSWLGLDWDEGPDVGGDFGPYRQRDRIDIYKKYARLLLEKGYAYYCYCTEEELERRRREALAREKPPGYDGRCRNLTPSERARLESLSRKPTIRFKVPDDIDKISVEDEIRGRVEFSRHGIRDFVIIRSNGVASFNFAVVIDDHLMQITHVIRGEDHLSNTPRQILIYQALGFEIPKFAHLPMILGEDKTRLSKRQGATSISEFRHLGYLPEAILNYLALLGWSPEEEGKEIFTPEELIKGFSLERVAKCPAVFDIEKLDWLGGVYIRKGEIDKITHLAMPYLKDSGFIEDGYNLEGVKAVVSLVRDYLTNMSQITEFVDYFFTPRFTIEKEAKEILKDEGSIKVISLIHLGLRKMIKLTEGGAHDLIKKVGHKLSLKGKDLYMPIRCSITGKTHGPELTKIMSILGRNECLERIERWIK
ncbi:MAG: glutamate--tRNA ligase [bacterium]|nr:glutamate--tRNA ligase [bacterium]